MKEGRKPTLHQFRGKMLSISEIANITGIKQATLYYRAERALPLDTPLTSSRARRFLFRQQWLTVNEIAGLVGVSTVTVRRRVSGDKVLEGDDLKDQHHEPPDHAVMIFFRGKRLCLAGWARELGMPVATVRSRYRAGWSIERIATTPRETKYASRVKKLTRMVVAFRRVRNHQIIQRIASSFRTNTPGYVQTFHNAKGTGVGRHAHDLHQNSENRI